MTTVRRDDTAAPNINCKRSNITPVELGKGYNKSLDARLTLPSGTHKPNNSTRGREASAFCHSPRQSAVTISRRGMMARRFYTVLGFVLLGLGNLWTASSFTSSTTTRTKSVPTLLAKPNNDADSTSSSSESNRRDVLQKSLTFGSLVASTLSTPIPILSSASAKNAKSRTEGYAIQHTEAEWSELLTSMQYFILRNGGTESPYSSILEGEERPGMYVCAGCGTPLFNANQKFHSGTGWPSFASPVMDKSNPSVSNVEMENVSQIQYQLAGAEVRCHSCGGHLGDVFADGFLFPGTPAFVSGKRYCIDGAALLFVPKDQKEGGELDIVRGDLPPKNGGRVFPG